MFERVCLWFRYSNVLHPRTTFVYVCIVFIFLGQNQLGICKKNAKYRGLSKEKPFVMRGRYGNYTWPERELSAKIDGDIMIGALHMIHERSEDKICGPIMPQGGIQALEVMLYTLDYINNNTDILPGVTLGVLAKDDCDRDIYGLEQSVDFIRGSISLVGGSEHACDDDMDSELFISGVLGAPSSVTSIQVANLLKLFKIPQVSFFSTSAELSSRDRYPFFLRTIPSDVNQAQAMVELVKMFGWSYVSVIYEESSYGIKGFNEVERALKDNNICIAWTDKLLKDSGVATEESYLRIVDELKKRPNARGVIIFGSDQEVGDLMKAVKKSKATGLFSWIGSDGWGARGLAFEGKEEEVEGAVTVQPLAYPVQGFDDYFLSRTPENNARNPWFIEYWEKQFMCKHPNGSLTPYNEKFNRTCTGEETYNETYPYSPEAQLQFVSDAVMAFAYAYSNLHAQVCEGRPGLCDEMDPPDGEMVKSELYLTNFTGLSGQQFNFLNNGDGPNKYRILNFRKFGEEDFRWVTVGYFIDGQLTQMNMTLLQFREQETFHPESVCSHPCNAGQAQEPVNDGSCCWTCITCTKYQYLPTTDRCEECDMGTLPDSNKSMCVPIPPIYLTYTDGVAIGAMIFSSIGIIATVFVILVFSKYKDTPVVKASGRELSFVLLSGIFLCYSMTFVLISKPGIIMCGIQRFGIGLCFALCYGAILTKTNRIARIFRAGKRTAKRPKFISPKSQLFICFGLISLQVIIGFLWLFMNPPEAGPFYATRDDHQLVCMAWVGFSYMIALSYPNMLIIVCTVYAILTRKIPEAFNESKYIGFTMYTTCIIWLAFVPIYFSTDKNIEIRIATMCFTISLSGTVALVCMFTPKLYIILFHPERNVRQSMMASKTSSVSYKYNSTSTSRMDSGTQSDDMEMTQRLKLSSSLSSGLSRSTSATQTCSNGTSISTQTLDSIGRELDPGDVQL